MIIEKIDLASSLPAPLLCRNIIHGSDSPESAKKEIGLWFKPEDLVTYGLDIHKWVYEK